MLHWPEWSSCWPWTYLLLSCSLFPWLIYELTRNIQTLQMLVTLRPHRLLMLSVQNLLKLDLFWLGVLSSISYMTPTLLWLVLQTPCPFLWLVCPAHCMAWSHSFLRVKPSLLWLLDQEVNLTYHKAELPTLTRHAYIWGGQEVFAAFHWVLDLCSFHGVFHRGSSSLVGITCLLLNSTRILTSWRAHKGVPDVL